MRSSRSTTRPVSSIAYVGSAEYYLASGIPQLQPKFDVVGSGCRQPGSAFKPFNYLTGIDDGDHDRRHDVHGHRPSTSAAATRRSTPTTRERGPVRVRTALQFSLNIPSVKAVAVNKPEHVFARAQDFGMRFRTETTTAGLSLALGVTGGPADRPGDGLRDARQRRQATSRTRRSWRSRTRAGQNVIEPFELPEGDQVASPQAAYIVTDILAGNTNPDGQPVLGRVRDREQGRRPPPGDAQDRHEQRREGPQRVRLHRPADGRGARGRRVRPGRRRVERQQRQHAVRRRRRLLDRRDDLRLAGLPPGGNRRRGRSTTSRAPDGPRPGEDRPVHRPAAEPRRSASHRGVVHRRHGADDGAARRASAARPSSTTLGVEKAFETWMRPTVTGSPGPPGAGHARRRQQHADGVLLQQPVPAVRPVVGRARRGRGCSRRDA